MTKRTLFVLAAILLAAGGLYFRSTNAKQARSRVSQVVAADSAGTDTTVSLATLKDYVKSHMGASVSYTLTGSYGRAQAAAQAAANAQAANGQVYAAAQAACSGKSDSITQAKCNQAYISSHLVNLPAQAPVAQPKQSDYQVSLRAPFWTPDPAGALLLGAAAALVLAFTTAGPRRRRR